MEDEVFDLYTAQLRVKAEAALKAKKLCTQAPPGRGSRWLTRELELHRMELEMQNESLRAAQEQLWESHNRYVELFQLAPVPYLTLDRSGMISDANQAAGELFGTDPDQLLGTYLSRYMCEAYGDELHRHLTRVREGCGGTDHGKEDCELSLTTPRGAVPVRLTSMAAKDAQTYRCTLQDLSASRQAEEERSRLNAQLLQAQKMEAIGTLANGVVHDFNNLLMGVMGCADVAQTVLAPDSPACLFLETIKQTAETGAALSRQLLTFSRHHAEEASVFELNAVVAQATVMLERLLGDDVVLDVKLNATDSRISAQPFQIVQVLTNLAVNARDAMPKGGTVLVQTDELHLERPNAALLAGDYLGLKVVDHGCGMDEETLKRVFDPFFTTKGPTKGTGLGLATVHRIISQARGQIRITSQPNQGTTFEILLPKAQAAVSYRPQPVKEKPGPQGHGTVLVVDDQRAVRMATRFHLEQSGYRVLEASSAEEALECCHKYPKPVDLVLADVMLPGLGGTDLTSELCRLRPTLKVVLMSATASETLVDRGRLQRGTPVLQKPCSARTLLHSVHSALSRESLLQERDSTHPQTCPQQSKARCARTLQEELERRTEPSSTPQAFSVHQPSPHAKTILVVEDNLASSLAICEYLRSVGWTVLHTADAPPAIELCRSRRADIDVILTDYSLPAMHGDRLAGELLKLCPSAAVVYMSGYPELKVTGPAGPVLLKPLDLNVIAETVASVANRRKAETG